MATAAGNAHSGAVLKNVQGIYDSGLQPTVQTWSVRTDSNTQSTTHNYMHGELEVGN
jgi:hypothetical protein